MTQVTPVPGMPDHVVGIIALEGEILSVLDLRTLLELPLSRLAEPAAIIVLRSDAMAFGVLAEGIVGIARYPASSLQHDMPTLADPDKTYLLGIAPGRTALLDAARLLADPRLVVDNDRQKWRQDGLVKGS
jgi:purine-binding chemotaxis protein CheW